MTLPTCTAADCLNPVLARGLCNKHYQRVQKYGSVDLPPRAKDRMCSDCGQRWALYSSGQCQACYRRERLGAKPFEGVCLHCGDPFQTKRRYSPESGRGMYCTRKCKERARIADGRAAEATLKHLYRKNYGLTIEQVRELRSKGCAICGLPGAEGRWGNLHMDHDHKTGRFRGALCHSCNLMLGQAKDDPVLLQKAIDYLARSALVT